MVAHGGPRGRELEARRTTIVGKKMRLTPPISRRFGTVDYVDSLHD
jgi:hypothetical protein